MESPRSLNRYNWKIFFLEVRSSDGRLCVKYSIINNWVLSNNRLSIIDYEKNNHLLNNNRSLKKIRYFQISIFKKNFLMLLYIDIIIILAKNSI